MAGHLRRHGVGWEGAFPNGVAPETGKKRRGYVYGKTRAERRRSSPQRSRSARKESGPRPRGRRSAST
jgi:hypothetical protein